MKISPSCGSVSGGKIWRRPRERIEERRADPGEREQQLAEQQQQQHDHAMQIGSRRNLVRQYQ